MSVIVERVIKNRTYYKYIKKCSLKIVKYILYYFKFKFITMKFIKTSKRALI